MGKEDEIIIPLKVNITTEQLYNPMFEDHRNEYKIRMAATTSDLYYNPIKSFISLIKIRMSIY